MVKKSALICASKGFFLKNPCLYVYSGEKETPYGGSNQEARVKLCYPIFPHSWTGLWKLRYLITPGILTGLMVPWQGPNPGFGHQSGQLPLHPWICPCVETPNPWNLYFVVYRNEGAFHEPSLTRLPMNFRGHPSTQTYGRRWFSRSWRDPYRCRSQFAVVSLFFLPLFPAILILCKCCVLQNFWKKPLEYAISARCKQGEWCRSFFPCDEDRVLLVGRFGVHSKNQW